MHSNILKYNNNSSNDNANNNTSIIDWLGKKHTHTHKHENSSIDLIIIVFPLFVCIFFLNIHHIEYVFFGQSQSNDLFIY